MTTALVLFARAPRAGLVKTRLIPTLGAAGAANLYRDLLAHALGIARAAPVSTRYLYAVDAAAREDFSAAPAAQGFELAVQADGDLGARMRDACATALRTHAAVILIGADLVDATVVDLALAARWLADDAEVVLGPVADGGYWLIGLREARTALFDAIPWGTAGVYAQTVARLAATYTPWRALPLRHDIDEPRDLVVHAAAIASLRSRR